jgi:branched-chain amino acid transport system substrate-binding protein
VTGTTYDALVTRYEADYGEAPLAAFHAHTYDATMMLLSAIEAVAVIDAEGTMWVDRAALRKELDNTSGFSGVTGTLECDAFGDCGAQAIAIVNHTDSADVEAGKANVVYSFSPTG